MKRAVFTLGIICLSLLFTFFSCEEKEKDNSNPTCGVSNPVEELDWLKDKIDEILLGSTEFATYSFYMIAELEGEPVFYFGSCHPTLDYAAVLYNCAGDSLGIRANFGEEITGDEVIWKPEGSQCNFAQ